MEPLKDIVVIYHAHCPDGMTSAWSAWKKFGDSASYLPASDRNVPPEGLIKKDIYIVDFCYPAATLKELLNTNNKVVVLDHHISSKDDVRSIPEGIFDIDRSGAGISWDYFNPNEKRPKLVDYIEDGDLFKRLLPNQERFSQRIIATPFTIEAYDELSKRCEDNFEDILKEGDAIELYVNHLFEIVEDDYDMVVFEGITMPAINIALPLTTKSQLLHRLYGRIPPIAMSYRYDKGFWKISLRSDGSVDCAELAKKYGGGGHKGAAGFIVSADFPLPFAKVKEKAHDIPR